MAGSVLKGTFWNIYTYRNGIFRIISSLTNPLLINKKKNLLQSTNRRSKFQSLLHYSFDNFQRFILGESIIPRIYPMVHRSIIVA